MGHFLDIENKASEVRKIGGIGGNIGVRFVTIPIKIDEYEFDCAIAWAQVEYVPFLLGRKDIFENFEIVFREKAKKVIFIWQGGEESYII